MFYKKYLLLLILIIIFISAGLYNQLNYKDINYYFKNLERNDLSEISIAGTIINKNSENLIIKDSMFGKEVVVRSVKDNWQIGQFINFKGVFHKEGYIEYIKGELIWDRKIKLYLSIIGFLLFVYILILDYKKIKFIE